MTAQALPAWPTIEQRAERHYQNMKRDQADYMAMRDEYAAQGYRAPRCIHGTDMWTDYDTMCGGCESGEFTEYSTDQEIRALALVFAQSEHETTIERDHATALRINNLRDFTIARGIKWTAEHDELAAGG